MLEVMREDYLRTARAKGLMDILVIGRHALKNALLPVVTISGYQFGRLLGGVVIVESIFVVPGMGTLLIDSIVHRDFIVLQAIVLLIAAVVLILNLMIDLLYGVPDPRSTTSNAIRRDKMMVDRETTTGRAIPDLRVDWRAPRSVMAVAS
jgi:ABC-type dipeptide/oligopeptide/nickel transport system permease component